MVFTQGMKPKMDLVQRELQGVKPLTQCCCGCSLTFGVALILLAYLATCCDESQKIPFRSPGKSQQKHVLIMKT
jgi:hypothetical protein